MFDPIFIGLGFIFSFLGFYSISSSWKLKGLRQYKRHLSKCPDYCLNHGAVHIEVRSIQGWFLTVSYLFSVFDLFPLFSMQFECNLHPITMTLLAATSEQERPSPKHNI